jgi:hypothetical protein
VQQVTAYDWPEEEYEDVAEHATNEKKQQTHHDIYKY